jgi:hypothetical protein
MRLRMHNLQADLAPALPTARGRNLVGPLAARPVTGLDYQVHALLDGSPITGTLQIVRMEDGSYLLPELNTPGPWSLRHRTE